MDDRTEKIFNIAFDPRGNEQEAISAFLRLRKLGNVSDMKSKVESIQPKAPQHRPSYNNYRSVPQYPSAQSSWATFTGGLIGLHLIYTYCSAFNKEGVCVQVRKASDLTNKSCSFEFRFVSYTDASLDLNLLLDRLSKTMHNYWRSSENNAPTCADWYKKEKNKPSAQEPTPENKSTKKWWNFFF